MVVLRDHFLTHEEGFDEQEGVVEKARVFSGSKVLLEVVGVFKTDRVFSKRLKLLS